MKSRTSLFLSLFFLLSPSAQARDVDTPEEEIRIEGFSEYLEKNQLAEKLRTSDIESHKKKNAEWEDLKNSSVYEYQQQKNTQAHQMADNGPEYREYLKEKEKSNLFATEIRQQFIQDKLDVRARNKRKVQLSEEEELMIYEKSARVDWKKRKFFAKSAAGSSTISRPGSGGATSGEFVPPPPPPPTSGPGYFESETPPPPPPLPYEPTFDSEIPPPPPPMFDDDGAF